MNDDELKRLIDEPGAAVTRSTALANALSKVIPIAQQPFETVQPTNVPRLRIQEEQLSLPRDEMFQVGPPRNPRNTGF